MESMDYTFVFLKLIKDLFDKMEDETTANIAKQKWKYFSMLIRHSVMEGLVNRQEFFIELADVLLDAHQKCSLEKMNLYRIIISFISLFTREITKNVFIARKFLYVIGLRLKGYMDETEKKKKTRQPPKQVFSELIACNNHRLIVLTSFGIITSIVIDCPEACIWMPLDESQVPITRQPPKQVFSELIACNNHRLIVLTSFGIITSIVIDCPEACIWMPLDESQVPMYLVGSPLDILPIDPLLFPTFLNEKESMEFSKGLKKLLASKLKQIHTRSCKIDNRWALNCSRETDFHLIVRASVDVVSLLDTADLTKPRAIFDLYAKLFGFTKADFFDGEIVIRVKAMLQWAITNEREGNFLNREAPAPGKASFRKEYSNLILLLIELQRASLFSHDEYIMLLIKYDELKDMDPIYPRLQRLLDPLKGLEPEQRRLSSVDDGGGGTSGRTSNNELIRNFLTPASTIQGNLADHEFCRLKDDVEDEIGFMEKPEGMSIHERLIIQLPIEQIEANRGAVNQRAIYLYGITSEREEVTKNLRNFSTSIIDKWMEFCYSFYRKKKTVKTKKNMMGLDESFKEFNEREEVTKNLRNFSTSIIDKWMEFCYSFYRKKKTVKTKKNMMGLDESFKDFKKLTYYDRLCVTGYCMDGYLQIIRDFISKSTSSLHLPIPEILDMLLSMAEAAQCIGWTISFFLECFPLFLSAEKILDSVRTDLAPGTFSSQQCFAIVGFLAEHYKYFLLSKEAIKICNALFRIIEPAIRAEDYPINGWTKAIAGFLIQARYDLRIRGKGFFAFRARDCQKLLPSHGSQIEYISEFDDDLFVSEDDLLNYSK
uniref:Mediator complex subunit Med12 LCEWAV-domain domain-containing protein n=1 Tax=Panagrolaimus sp. ES5 TaxID=591445 RepID=A0AC34F0B6_9BILA